MFVMGPHANFKNPGNAWLLFFTVTAVLLLAQFLTKFRFSLPLRLLDRLPNIYQSKAFLFVTFVAALPVAMLFSTAHGIGFRYSSVPLSESGPLAIIATIYRPYFCSLVIYYFLLIISGVEVSKMQRVLALGHLVNWFLFANGSVDLLWGVVILVIGCFGNQARRFFVSNNRLNLGNLSKRIVVALLCCLIAYGIVFFGFANKIGFDEAVLLFNSEFAGKILYYLYYRLAVFPSSLDLVLERGLDFDLYQMVFENELRNIGYRISIILQMPMARPDIEGLNRLNYLLLYTDPAAVSAGASPGPLASFAYFPALPLNLMLCSVYISIILNTYSRLIKVKIGERITVFTILFFIIINFAFLHNPISTFARVGPELFRTGVYLLAMSLAFRQARLVWRKESFHG